MTFTTTSATTNFPLYKLCLDDLSIIISLQNFKMASICRVDEQASLKCIRIEYADGTDVVILSKTVLFQKHTLHFLESIFCIVAGTHIAHTPEETAAVAETLIEEFSL